jgi:phage terminase Nu1 subunit (DNA packaging protein)
MPTEPSQTIELTAGQAGSFVGVKAQQFLNLLKSPYPPPRLGNKKYRSDQLGEWFKARILREHTVAGSDGERLDPAHETARKNKELADKTAIENQVRRGELIEADEVEGAWADIMSRVRTRMLRIPSTVAPLVLGMNDQIEIQQAIDDAVRDALSEMSADWRDGDNDTG